ncbi:Ras-related protein RABF2a [Tritrichomonas foetus]|uniref:Ras-related protein RABF2a n=1 Tax=Tritrichomonas foetus TaxID=1144522 RepID=A0A1J4KBJ0_9EUKA|nr:Ras-related protein RABF2a [Tritrichomonas foetus]|eukprot:OHT06845.1 Ras-related protein RABF2a [Tritrichomonas foetus]
MRKASGGISEKIVMLGATQTGKTSLVTRFIMEKFISSTEATIGAAFLTKKINVDGKDITMDIWDTGGQERYRALAPMYYRDARAAIIVFDLTNSSTILDAEEWINEIRDHGAKHSLIYVAANKSDLRNEISISEKDLNEFKFANQIDHMYITSALNGQNVNKMFFDVAKELIASLPATDDEKGDAKIGVEAPKQSSGCCF